MGGNATYSDGAVLADMVGWARENPADCPVVEYSTTAYSGTTNVVINGSDWGQPGGLIETTVTGSVAAYSVAVLTMWAKANNGPGAVPIVLELLADGAVVAADSTVDPALTADWQEYSRVYSAATMAAIAGQEMTIRLGVQPGGPGTQSAFDTVTMVPEPATMALLGLGGLFLRRRRA